MLWLYHLHYFDDLVAQNTDDRKGWHDALLHRWIDENPPLDGIGWKPYPLSRRVVNWIKWELNGQTLSEQAIGSLTLQLRALRQQIEYHVLGNHLIANAKALLFGGLFVHGKEPEEWARTGCMILNKELPEQILKDGGHFERSPMYHAIVLEDLMDLVNMAEAYDGESLWGLPGNLDLWKRYISSMSLWLKAMCLPDNRITLMNDSAFGMASSPDSLDDYARRLGLKQTASAPSPVMKLPESGYIRLACSDLAVILDVGPIGPDYLPAHAHADTLSFELSCGERRIIVDTGTSQYADGPERAYERSTRAHNTVEIDGANSSDVWGSFRVGRRACPIDLQTAEWEGKVSCAHNGYRHLRGGPTHRRIFHLKRDAVLIRDEVSGGGAHLIAAYLHFHPDVAITEKAANLFEMRWLPEGFGYVRTERWATHELLTGWHAPFFGIRAPCKVLRVTYSGNLPFTATTEIATGTQG